MNVLVQEMIFLPLALLLWVKASYLHTNVSAIILTAPVTVQIKGT